MAVQGIVLTYDTKMWKKKQTVFRIIYYKGLLKYFSSYCELCKPKIIIVKGED